MTRPLVYLSGGMRGLTGAEARRWRDLASRLLRENYNIGVLDPMRDLRAIADTDVIRATYDSHNPFLSNTGMLHRDYLDVQRCSGVLVNLLNHTQTSIGSIIEVGWAYALRKPIVVVLEKNDVLYGDHPLLQATISYRVTTVEDGVCVFGSLLKT